MPALSSQFQFIINSGSFTTTTVAIPSAAIAPDGTANFYSIPQKGDGYFGAADGLHTVTYTVTPNFSGSLSMQATLATNPGNVDWFTVANSTVTYTFPIVPATTTTNYVNFTGNFVWVRAVVNRDGTNPNGTVNFINYNH
jgi:hypothetical protein